MRAVAWLLLAWLLLAWPAAAQATRADLAARFVIVDAEIGAGEHEGERWLRANELFDQATFDFFTGDFSQTARRLVELRVLWNGWGAAQARTARALSAVRLVPEPAWGAGWALSCAGVYGAPELAGVRVDGLVQITDQDGNEAGSGKLRVVFDAEGNPPDVAMPVVTRGVPVDADGLVFTVRDAAGHAYSAACWSRLERAPSALAAELVARANAMPEGDLSGARAAFLSRCALLVDAPAPDRSAEFLSPPFRLLPELRAEIEALEEGRDPYAGRPGGLWRTFALGRRARGFYVHAPASVAASQEPVPLVVALHGAGADEMFFPFASGAGHLVQLAEERGFLLACPRTADVSFNPRGFDALVETLAESYAVDRERVYVLGHSMGAMATANLTRKRGAAIARAVCIAGAQELGLGTPTLLLAGARDRVVSASGVRRAYEAARAAGAEVAYEEYAGGHTLPLARALTRAVQWFGLAP